ncbi:flagellar assembly protein FliH [Myxococcota bacterium]|nr:flagellar assembly protein FliH [Myxococcota bacterium]
MATYRLETLLGIRERAEKDAKEAFAAAMAALNREKKTLQDMEDELQRMIDDRKRRREEYSQKLASGEMKVTDQSAAYRYIERLKEREAEQAARIDGQKEQVREAEKVLKRMQDALIQATQDLKALQKHKEKWAEEVKKERQMREEDNLDEIAQTIFNQGRKNPS